MDINLNGQPTVDSYETVRSRSVVVGELDFALTLFLNSHESNNKLFCRRKEYYRILPEYIHLTCSIVM